MAIQLANDSILVIDRQTMTGSAVAYQIPAKTRSIRFHAIDGDVTMASTSGGDAWTIKQNLVQPWIESADMENQKVYFNGTNNHVLEIMILKRS